ncbi:hypothetical protein POTOM_028580 [Populus tomentosa]|uniref:Transmembrane protein n=1 Tax=Populus tomentosa TaxID=118781 RepID=A0A8X8CLH7_POPTO|nr:hypothetical protein POTOM_028580 [Populus tomentosa]
MAVSFFYALAIRCCRLLLLCLYSTPLKGTFVLSLHALSVLLLGCIFLFQISVVPFIYRLPTLLGSRGSCRQAAAKTFGCYRTVLLCSHGLPCSGLPCCCFQGLFLASFRVLSSFEGDGALRRRSSSLASVDHPNRPLTREHGGLMRWPENFYRPREQRLFLDDGTLPFYVLILLNLLASCATMDSSTTTNDNVYCKLLPQGKRPFSSDQALLSTRETKALVSKFASSQEMLEKAFVGETTIHQNTVL